MEIAFKDRQFQVETAEALVEEGGVGWNGARGTLLEKQSQHKYPALVS